MSEQLTLSRATPAALYQQVKEHVLRKIAEGAWRAGDRVPSEQELVATFGVARMTVNRALRELAEQGSIVRVAGVGSFVAEDKPQELRALLDALYGRWLDYRHRRRGAS